MSEIRWAMVEDGEYNEQTAKVGQSVVAIYSDRDGEYWECQIDGGQAFTLDATDMYGARREAIAEALTP